MKRLACLDTIGLWVPTDSGLLNVQLRGEFYDAPHSIGQLLAVAEHWHIEQLWIHRSFLECAGEPIMVAPLWDVFPQMPTVSGWYRAHRPEQRGGEVQLVLPAWPVGQESAMLWNKAESGADLIRDVQAYNTALRFDYRWTPGATGSALMREVHGGGHSHDHRYLQLDTPQEPAPPAALHPDPARDLNWIRSLTPEESAMHYLHAFDKNSAYLGACAALELGLGEWEHMTESWHAYPYSKHFLPGYFRVDEYCTTKILPLLMPPITDPDGHEMANPSAPLWITTPTLIAALEAGYDMEIGESYMWPVQSRVLAPWQARLRVARQELRDMPLPLSVLKLTYSMGIASLDGWWRREKTVPDMLYRPDWRHMVIAQAAANVWRDTLRAVNNGVHVVGIATDCLYVVSDLPAIETAEIAGLKLGPNIGQYKIAQDSVPLDDVRPFLEQTPMLWELRAYLMKRSREYALSSASQSADSTAADH